MNPESNVYRKLVQFANFSRKIGTIAALFATCWGAVEWALHWRQDRQHDVLEQIKTYGSFKDLIEKSHATELKVNAWMRNDWDKYNTKKKQDDLLDKYKTGANIYYSEEMKIFREIHTYFEELGIVVNHRAVEFEAFFDAVTFPSDYEEQTRAFHKMIADHWFGEHGIAGFTENMQKMGYQYALARVEGFASQARKTPDPTEKARLEKERDYWIKYGKELKELLVD